MTYTKYLFSLWAITTILIAPSSAQTSIWDDYEPAKNWTDNINFESNAGAVFATATGKDSDPQFALNYAAKADWVARSGLSIKATGQIRLQSQNNRRPYGALENNIDGYSLVLGGASSATIDKSKTTIEAAHINIKGSWGTLRFGIGQGVGKRFDESPDPVFKEAKLNNASLFPEETSIVQTHNGISGNLPKLSTESPRWVGLKLGASVAIPAKIRSSYTPISQLIANDTISIEGTPIELAANYTTKLDRFGVRVQSSASYARLEAKSTSAQTSDTSNAFAGAVNLSGSTWSAGVAMRKTDTLFSNGTYETIILGGRIQPKNTPHDLYISSQLGSVHDDAFHIDGNIYEIGLGFSINKNLDLALAYRGFEPKKAQTYRTVSNNTGLVIELSLSF